MKKKKLKVMGLSYSQTQAGSYIVVLSEVKGNRKIPIVVKATDAQQIALKLEKIKSPRPLTHDLFKSLASNYSINATEVFIHSVVEGVFYCKILLDNDEIQTEMECGIGDGITLSLIFGCPIMVATDVLESTGINLNDDGTEPTKDETEDLDIELVDANPKKRVVSIEDLEKMMQKALENEEYEIAAELRDRINELKESL
jgi:bifunctional DNase/RNase